MKAKPALVLACALLSLWGIHWCLPEKARIRRVLPPNLDNPEFHRAMETSWRSLHASLGKDILLNPESFSMGFDKMAVVEAGWKTPPPVLMNSSRSFHLRSGHEDEPDILVALSRIKPHRLELNPRIYFYGGAYLYPLGAWIAALSLATPAVLVPGIGFYLEHPDKIAWIYLLGRLFSAAIYGVGVWLLYCTGKKLFNEKAGVLAAALFAVSPGIVLQAHYMKPHLLGSVFMLASFYFCARLLETGNPKNGAWAGAMVGLAAGAVIHLWSGLLVVALTLALRIRKGNRLRSEWRWVAGAALAAWAAFLAANPYWLSESAIAWKATGEVGRFAGKDISRTLRFAFYGLPHGLTWPVFFCVLAGLFNSRNLKEPVRLLALFSFIGLMLTTWIFPTVDKFDSLRYFGGIGLGFLLAGASLAEWTPRWRRAAAVALIYAAIFSAVLDYNLYLDSNGRSTKHAAGDWIEQNLPPGSELGFLRLPQPSNSPYFRWNKYRLKFIESKVLAQWSDVRALPEYLILTCPTYDDRPAIKTVLTRHYRRIKAFKPYSLLWIVPPIGESYGNPLVEIYEKMQSLNKI